MFSDVHKHVGQKLANVKIDNHPYPHFVIDNIFPDEFYKELLKNPIPKNDLVNLVESKRVGSGYSGARYVVNLDPSMPTLSYELRSLYENFAKWLHYYFKNMLLNKFNLPTNNILADALYTKDYQTYSLGPHTDKITKVLTCLIYLPTDNSLSQYGTTIYTPKDKTFTCAGGPHHKRKDFDIFKTIEFVPNRMFCFQKTNNSFHGVEPVDSDVERTLLIFDLQREI